jgi:oxygen-dependent protoporphyrinogen oxidase
VVDYVANPFVAGTFAGDPEQLSLRHAFPGCTAWSAATAR